MINDTRPALSKKAIKKTVKTTRFENKFGELELVPTAEKASTRVISKRSDLQEFTCK